MTALVDHSSAVDGWWQASNRELVDTVSVLECRMRRDYASLLSVLGELDSRDAVGELGYPGLAALVQDVLRIGRGQALRRVEHARAVTPSRSPSGGVVAAPLGQVGAAMADGVLGPEHLDAIGKVFKGLPDTVTVEQREQAEAILVEHARTMSPRSVAILGHRIRDHLDPDGVEPDERGARRKGNRLWFRQWHTGRVDVRAELEPEAGALLLGLLSPLAKPRPAADDVRDARTPAERNGAAFAEILRLVADHGQRPTEGGERPHLNVTVSFDVLAQQLGSGLLHGSGELSAEAVRVLACDAKIIPMVLGTNSEPLDVGRASYVVPTAMRRALVVRDRGCAFPECTRPTSWCQAHHIIPVRHEARDCPSGGERPPTLNCRSSSVKLRAA